MISYSNLMLYHLLLKENDAVYLMYLCVVDNVYN